ncbi:MAG: hypothetical protein R8G66_03340 [Cytophagales bacterium]|nr:hypothetical protein [Cytophagales bacterium]
MTHKFLFFAFLTLVFTACDEDAEVAPCESGATLLIGDNTNQCGVMSRFSHRIRNNEEQFYLYLDYFPFGNADVRLDPGTIFEEGVTYQRLEGAGYSAVHLGGINTFIITIEKVDRQNQLLTLSFMLDGTVLDNNTSFVMSGTLEDMPLTEELN